MMPWFGFEKTDIYPNMIALILAAGMGNRLSGCDGTHHPKCLLKFSDKTLLERHVTILREFGIEKIILVVGYRAHEIQSVIHQIGAADFIETVSNARYRDGSVGSMWSARDALNSGQHVLFMDADVLYDPQIITALISGPGKTCFAFDTSYEDGEEPVKFCLNNGCPVEFRKAVSAKIYDTVGEWVGFIRLAPDFAQALAGRTCHYVKNGRGSEPYEEAVRDLLLGELGATVGAVDIAGKAWIEIDFPEDVIRAENEILPQLEPV